MKILIFFKCQKHKSFVFSNNARCFALRIVAVSSEVLTEEIQANSPLKRPKKEKQKSISPPVSSQLW
jgi:hypothetical protein